MAGFLVLSPCFAPLQRYQSASTCVPRQSRGSPDARLIVAEPVVVGSLARLGQRIV